MLKKLFCIGLLSLSATTISWGNGLYFGPSLGYETVWSDSVPGVSTVRYQGIDPRLTVGLGGIVGADHIYMAGEIWGMRSVELHNSTQGYPSSVASLSVSWSFGAGLLVGYKFDQVLMGFVRLGALDSRFENLEVWRMGYQGGIGLDYMISPCWDARLEYDYTRYNSVSIVDNPNMTTFFASVLYSIG